VTPEQQALRDALAGLPTRAADAAAHLVHPSVAAVVGEWSAREVVLHLAAVEVEVWHPRLDILATGIFPIWPWVEPGLWEGPGNTTFVGALAALTEFRAATIARLDALDDAGWARRGRHATYGDLDVAALMRIALRHDEEHLAQIQEKVVPSST
jgi:hypothetical protein